MRGGVKPVEDKDQTSDWVIEARRRLAKKRRKKPETKAAQIWALWPEIRLALAEGQRIRTIAAWLCEEIEIPVTADTLRSYIARCRRKERTGCTAPSVQIGTEKLADYDPMALARRALNKPRFDIRQLHNDGDPSEQNLI